MNHLFFRKKATVATTNSGLQITKGMLALAALFLLLLGYYIAAEVTQPKEVYLTPSNLQQYLDFDCVISEPNRNSRSAACEIRFTGKENTIYKDVHITCSLVPYDSSRDWGWVTEKVDPCTLNQDGSLSGNGWVHALYDYSCQIKPVYYVKIHTVTGTVILN